jgi:hypothetical protein
MPGDFIDLRDLIKDLKNIRLALEQYDDSLAKKCVEYLTKAIDTLEAYWKVYQGEHERQGRSASLLREWTKNKSSKGGQNSSRRKQQSLVKSQQSSDDESDYIVVEAYTRKDGTTVREHRRRKSRR